MFTSVQERVIPVLLSPSWWMTSRSWSSSWLPPRPMKANFNLFPEVLIIDGTYSVNKLRMPLYTFLVEDGDGVGRVAAYCFVCNECKATIDAVLKQFATIYDVSLVSCVTVDKSLNEIIYLCGSCCTKMLSFCTQVIC